MHRYTKEQKRRNTKVQIHTNTKVQMHKTQNTTDLLPSPCNVLDRRPSSADNHPKTCVCRCNCHHFQHFHHFQDCLHCHHCHQLNIIGVRIAKGGREALIDPFSDFPFQTIQNIVIVFLRHHHRIEE